MGIFLKLMKKNNSKTKVVSHMKQNVQSIDCSGSLTPELEGSSRTNPHPSRNQSLNTNPQPKKGDKQ